MVTDLTPATQTPERTVLRWLDGTIADDHAAMEAATQLVRRAFSALIPEMRQRQIATYDKTAAVTAHVLLALRDADAGEAS